jgi:hypothetical protein
MILLCSSQEPHHGWILPHLYTASNHRPDLARVSLGWEIMHTYMAAMMAKVSFANELIRVASYHPAFDYFIANQMVAIFLNPSDGLVLFHQP